MEQAEQGKPAPRVTFFCFNGIGRSEVMKGDFEKFLERNGLVGAVDVRKAGITRRGSEEKIAGSNHVVGVYAEVLQDLQRIVDENHLATQVHECNTGARDQEWKEKLLDKILPGWRQRVARPER